MIFFTSVTGSGTREVTYTKKKIFEIHQRHFTANLDIQIQILEDNISKRGTNNSQIDTNTKTVVKKILCSLKSKFKQSHYIRDWYYEKNEKCLQSLVNFKVNIILYGQYNNIIICNN